MNTAILEEEQYQHLVNAFIVEMSQHPARTTDVSWSWETIFKPGIKNLSINSCWKQACDRRLRRKALQVQLNAKNFDFKRYTELKREFLAWEREALHGFAVRSRVESVDGEEASVFHVQKEQDNGRKSTITKLVTSANRPVDSEADVNAEILTHFTRIFTPSSRLPPTTFLLNLFCGG